MNVHVLQILLLCTYVAYATCSCDKAIGREREICLDERVAKGSICDKFSAEGTNLCNDKRWGRLEVKNWACGSHVRRKDAATAPNTITFSQAKKDDHYLLVMVDPDAPSRSNPTYRYWEHWIRANIRGETLISGKYDGTDFVSYNPPSPPKGTGPHRYQFFLFNKAGADLKGVNASGQRGKFDLMMFIKENNLCNKLVATFQFNAQNPDGAV